MIAKYIKKINILLYIVFLLFPVLLIGCSSESPRVETEFVFGTTCSITLYKGYSQVSFDMVFSRMREIEGKMSVTIPDSEVSEVNKKAGLEAVPVSEETFFLISKALGIARETGGALDISVGPLVSEWAIGSEDAHVPSERRIQELLRFVGYEGIILDSEKRTVFLEEEGMKIDLGAIAKGYAADEAVKLLKKEGFSKGIIDFGGNIVVFGSKKNKSPWRIGIQQPAGNRGTYFGIVQIETGAVVSSGTYERFFIQDGVKYHHILDPGTGYPSRNELDSVTIITDAAVDADGYSTAVFVLGLEEGYSFVESKNDIDAVFVTKDRDVYLTSGVTDRFIQSDADYPIVPIETGPRTE